MLPSVTAVGGCPRSPGGGLRGRRLGRRAVVRVMCVGVESLRAARLHRAQKRDRRDRRPARVRVVVPAGTGRAARDLRRALHRLDPLDDRVAQLRVVPARLDRPGLARPPVLRLEEDRVVRLVPGHPEAHARKRDAVRVDEGAAVALLGRGREVPEIARVRRRDVPALRRVRPGRRADDREDRLHPADDREAHRAVVRVPVVRRIVRVCGPLRLAGRHADPRSRPPEVDAQKLCPGLLQLREDEVGLAVEHDAIVEDPDAERGRRRGGRGEDASDDDGECGERRARPTHARRRSRPTPGCGGAPRRARSRAPTRGSAAPA